MTVLLAILRFDTIGAQTLGASPFFEPGNMSSIAMPREGTAACLTELSGFCWWQ